TEDAEQALALLRGFHPDLMLVDIELPGMDGLSLTRRVKMNPSTRDIVVLALSGRAGSDQDEEARAAGCDGYITKPVDSATLLSRIREHLDRHVHAPDEASPGVAGRPIPAGDGPADDLDLESLKRSFLEESAVQSQQMVETLDGSFDASKPARLCHQWVGAAGILGYMA